MSSVRASLVANVSIGRPDNTDSASTLSRMLVTEHTKSFVISPRSGGIRPSRRSRRSGYRARVFLLTARFVFALRATRFATFRRRARRTGAGVSPAGRTVSS